MLQKGTIHPLKQENSNATNAPKLSKKEAKIDWSEPNINIFNKIRAFKPFPGTFMVMDGKRIAVEWAYPLDENTSKKPGTVIKIGSDFIDVQCGKGVLRIIRIKPEGKREMSIHDFILGTDIPEGILLN
jgi:methionyl-tRNA formyltransferase